MLASIITPSFNQARFLTEALESVLRQDYSEVECLVLDGGSQDESAEIIEQYAHRLAFWRCAPDGGQSQAINEGLQRARGEVVGWLNSDDVLRPNAVRDAVAYFRTHPDVDIVFGKTQFIDELGAPIRVSELDGPFDYDEFIVNCRNSIPQPSAFIRRSVFDNVGLLDEGLQFLMDWEFWMRAGLQHRIAYVPEIWSSYRLHAESKTISRFAGEVPAELEAIYVSYFANPSVPDNIRTHEDLAFSNMYLTAAGFAMEGGLVSDSRHLAAKALRAKPSTLMSPAGLHKLLYCYYGRTRAYSALRDLHRRNVHS